MTEPKTKKILVVEDEQAYARALVLKLQHAGYVVESVTNGEEALKIITKQNFDLLLCDLIMPKVNGFQVLQEIQSRGLHLPTIILTNLTQDSDLKKTQALGAIDFISKSNTTIADVITKIQQHFSS